jgi:hypothetical protein
MCLYLVKLEMREPRTSQGWGQAWTASFNVSLLSQVPKSPPTASCTAQLACSGGGLLFLIELMECSLCWHCPQCYTCVTSFHPHSCRWEYRWEWQGQESHGCQSGSRLAWSSCLLTCLLCASQPFYLLEVPHLPCLILPSPVLSSSLSPGHPSLQRTAVAQGWGTLRCDACCGLYPPL